jgi:two-component system, chemotaxis family, sensor kinase CheA
MGELQQLFFESAAELVQALNDEALRLEKSPADNEAARSLRRTVHTLKGDSAACGFRELSELCHEFEDVLTLENPATANLVPEIALRAADVFAVLLEAYRNGTKLPSIQQLRTDIARLAHTDARETPGKKKKKKVPGKRTIWSEYEQLAIARARAASKRLYHVTVEIDPQCGMPIAGRQMIQLALAEMGEVLALYPLEGSHEPIKQIEAAVASEKAAEQIRAKISIPTIAANARVVPLRIAALPEAQVHVPAKTVALDEHAPAAGDDPAAQENASAPSSDGEKDEVVAQPAPAAGPDNVLRVDAERIDNVLNLVGELILAKSMLQQAFAEFGRRFPKDGLRGKFSDAMAFQNRVLNDLQHSVMKIRMVPVDQLFRRFPRIVRDVGRQCGKEVELVIRGGQTDLDKSILDAIAEPLTHMVRNAIGHGLETAEERTRTGKRPQGLLRLDAYHQGNQVVIEVTDDGRGIDSEKVRQRAISLAIVNSEQASRLSETEALALIFQPGFSTAEQITELSGRGVGLDVVQSVLTRLKGTIQIETNKGRGTTFRLRLPLTLAIIRALLFRVEKRLYALPLNAVAEIARTFEESIHQVEHYDVLQLRDDILPLLRLGSKAANPLDATRQKLFVLVIQTGERKFGLIVDEVVGEEELVIKALDDRSITTDIVSGASILGDGRVVLILNLTALTDRFMRARPDANGSRLSGLLSGVGATVNVAGSPGAAQGMAGGRS